MTTFAPTIVTEGLHKSYGQVHALDGLDLVAEEGSVLAVLGPNGSGKTTTVRILTTLLKPDSGRAEVEGLDVVKHAAALRSRIGLTGQYAAVDESLTGYENLTMFGQLYHLPGAAAKRRARALLERFDLVDAASRLVRTYSGGMRRRLDLAASLIVSPPILFLDEPTTGLDPRARLAVWEVISDLVAQGTTVFLTTQYLEEADHLAHHIVVIAQGRVIAQGTADELKTQIGGERLELTVAAGFDLQAALQALRPHSSGEMHMSGTRGPVILSIHGGLGGADQARLIANWLNTSTYRILSPSRPGYLGTSLDSGKTFEQQADLLAALLDHLKIENVAVLCFSAGGPPAYQFAMRHPDRVWALVAVSSISGYYHMPETDGPITQAIFMSTLGQKIVQMINEKKPEILLKEALQVTGSYTKEQQKRQIDHVMNSPQALAFWKALLGAMNPYHEREKGNENDMEESLKLTHLPLEKVQCPSLIIHGTYDVDAKFSDGVYAYEHIPGVQRYWIEEGDHLGFWLSPYAEQAQEVARAFLEEHAPGEHVAR